MTDFSVLPDDLPVPTDDGAAEHLLGQPMPELTLQSSDGRSVKLAQLDAGRTVIYLYPLTGQPGVDLPEGWDAIPGARGCSTEACDFRDHFADLQTAGATEVWGLSSQDSAYQGELVQRLHLPFAILSDPQFALGHQLGLPTFSSDGIPGSTAGSRSWSAIAGLSTCFIRFFRPTPTPSKSSPGCVRIPPTEHQTSGVALYGCCRTLIEVI